MAVGQNWLLGEDSQRRVSETESEAMLMAYDKAEFEAEGKGSLMVDDGSNEEIE
mgnify:CR=1 FL=1|jgi:hypothetical protein